MFNTYKTSTNNISIHALRVEGDTLFLMALIINKGFLSTPSGWRATYCKFPKVLPL